MKKGLEAVNLLRSFNLKAALTFYDHKHKITWKSFDGKNTAYQLDQWVVNSLTHIKDAYVIDYGVHSDHSAIKIDLKLKKVKKKLTLCKQIINWDLFLDEKNKSNFNINLKDKINDFLFLNGPSDMTYSVFSNLLMRSSSEVASKKRDNTSGWFNESKEMLQPLFEKRAKTLNNVRQNDIPSSEAKDMCRLANKNLQEAIAVAKENWTSKLVDKIHQMSESPKKSWKAVKTLKKWIHGHHEEPNTTRFKHFDGTFTTTDSERIEKLKTHFHTVYNSKVIIDWDLLKELEQKSSKDDLGLPLSYLEFLDAIKNLLSIMLVVLMVSLRTP